MKLDTTLKNLKNSDFILTWYPPETGSIMYRTSCRYHDIEFSEYGLTREESTKRIFDKLDKMNITRITL